MKHQYSPIFREMWFVDCPYMYIENLTEVVKVAKQLQVSTDHKKLSIANAIHGPPDHRRQFKALNIQKEVL